MTTPTYTPRAGSLASQVISFFRNNPDEELLLEDITDKFAATRGNVHTLLSDAVKAELLARERNADGDYLYKPGLAPALDKTAESGLRRVADGLADRSHDCRAQRLKCVGNGVVALCAAAAAVVLVHRMKEAA